MTNPFTGDGTMSLFAAATEKTAKAKTAKPKKNTIWVVGTSEEDLKVGIAVKTLVELSADEKALKAKMALQKAIVLKVAKKNHVRDFCDLGVQPDTPMKVQNADGLAVSYIVQDRSGQYAAKPEQIEVMVQLLGEDAAANLTYTETSLGFDRVILAIPGVSEAIEKSLMSAIKKMIKAEVLTGEQADELIVAKSKTAFKPGTLDRAALLCGNDTTKMSQFLDALSSSCTRYIKC